MFYLYIFAYHFYGAFFLPATCCYCTIQRRDRLTQSLFFFFFFFSSRRRHTRSLCDWSSDVCSSDLVAGQGRVVQNYGNRAGGKATLPRYIADGCSCLLDALPFHSSPLCLVAVRRVSWTGPLFSH